MVNKKAPNSYIDVLSIIEHPAFNQFYDDLIAEGSVGIDEGNGGGGAIGDMINVELKNNYKDYDLYFPEIVSDEEEELVSPNLDVSNLAKYHGHSLAQLQSWIVKGEVFHSQEMTVKTNFGEYMISADLFNATTYNEYLSKILAEITTTLGKTKANGHSRKLPLMQINQPKFVGILDVFIRTKLFGCEFNPFINENWRILMLKGTNITQHITKEISRAVYNM